MIVKEIRIIEVKNGFRVHVFYPSETEEEYVFSTIDEVNIFLKETFKRKDTKPTKAKA